MSRRTISQALQIAGLGEEAVAFLKPTAAERPADVSPSEVDVPAETEAVKRRPEPGTRPPGRPSDTQPNVPPPGLVSMTFRLPGHLPDELIRVSAARKVRRAKPWSQQEIVAEALAQWFKRNGD